MKKIILTTILILSTGCGSVAISNLRASTAFALNCPIQQVKLSNKQNYNTFFNGGMRQYRAKCNNLIYFCSAQINENKTGFVSNCRRVTK